MGDVIEVVAGGVLGREQRAGDVEARHRGRAQRIEPLLDFLGRPELLGGVAEGLFGAVPPAPLDGITDGADQQVVVDLAFDQVILAPAWTALMAAVSSS